MAIYRYNECEHGGGFIGLRVVVIVGAQSMQKYFSFTVDNLPVSASEEEEKIIEEKAIQLEASYQMKVKMSYKALPLLIALLFSCTINAQEGNLTFKSFNKAKKVLASQVYNQLPNKTLYCGASLKGKKITNPNGFYSSKYKKRGKKIEWEHVVPAENFGRTFSEWRNGDPLCVTCSLKSRC